MAITQRILGTRASEKLRPGPVKVKTAKPLANHPVPHTHAQPLPHVPLFCLLLRFLSLPSLLHPPLHLFPGAYSPSHLSIVPQSPPPRGFTPRLCPVTCCSSRHGKEAQDWATKQGLKNHVEMHTADLLEGQVPVFSWHISTSIRPMLPQMPPDLQQPSLPIHLTTPASRHTRPQRSPPLMSRFAHPEGRTRDLGPLVFGVPLGSHPQQRHKSLGGHLLSLPKLVLRRERGGKQNKQRPPTTCEDGVKSGWSPTRCSQNASENSTILHQTHDDDEYDFHPLRGRKRVN